MGKKILVIEDETEVAKMIKTRLEASQFSVATASDGVEGLDAMSSDVPDLIILDVMMPRMDGYTFLRELKSKQMKTLPPIIVLTAKDQLKELFQMEGVADYITKPFDAQDLLTKVQTHLA